MPVRPKKRPAKERAARPTVPDAVAVFDAEGELIGWDESSVHAHYAERGLPGRCDDDCAERGHIGPW